jgi:hypothetical protein
MKHNIVNLSVSTVETERQKVLNGTIANIRPVYPALSFFVNAILICCCLSLHFRRESRDSSVGIATRLWAG